MPRIAYVNGRYLPRDQGAVSIEDRGYQFADGIYEVIWVRGGRIIDLEGHMERLERSLDELSIKRPFARSVFAVILAQCLRRNRLADGYLYIQVSRGVAPRNHVYPDHGRASVVVTASRARPYDPKVMEKGVRVITIPDIRWQRCDIKAIALLPNVMGKQRAKEAGAFEAWQINALGEVTEGSVSNAWIITHEGEIITHPANNSILSGITRRAVLALVREQGLKLAERPFTLEEALVADEAFLTGTTNFIVPIVKIDKTPVGNGKPGPVTLDLHQAYLTYMDKQNEGC
ncbi:MAG: D-amino-acid transaminase [Rhodospirillaceae bacterium]|jgi:D-alanine transaminase|nr:D-amino-acid transaminase [Rhodospirillaceae bacterium]MBT5374315.1 D-amino-acid transaminase [Rhodospirillaceae bacterium]MBT5659072.1 D-amino-acid transaminase [Rhodospirillaceae bacterium]